VSGKTIAVDLSVRLRSLERAGARPVSGRRNPVLLRGAGGTALFFTLVGLGGCDVKQPLIWSQSLHRYGHHRTHHDAEPESQQAMVTLLVNTIFLVAHPLAALEIS